MKVIHTNTLNQAQQKEICSLWNKEYPQSLNWTGMAGFERYLNRLETPWHVIIYNEDKEICGWWSDFRREDDIWFVLILAQEAQGKGLGSQLLTAAKKRNSVLNGWVIDEEEHKKNDGTRYRSPINFYLKNDFELEEETRLETDQISAVKMHWVNYDN